MNREEIGKAAFARREMLKVDLVDLALATGRTINDISGIEQSIGTLSDEVRADYLAQIQRKSREQILFDAAQAAKAFVMPKAVEVTPPSKELVLPVIARELREFRKRHGMITQDLADLLKLSKSYVQRIMAGDYVPAADTMLSIRKKMEGYDGKQRTPKKVVAATAPAPKPASKPSPAPAEKPKKKVEPKVAPKAAPLPTPSASREEQIREIYEITGIQPTAAEKAGAVPAPPAAYKPTVSLERSAGVFLPDGGNIAPLLKLDGKTMHVFTLVPGGVYVSHVITRE
jgi:transcriptional regulator with XRE-family HTH domain